VERGESGCVRVAAATSRRRTGERDLNTEHTAPPRLPAGRRGML